jgi:hypothetical protein
MEADFNFANKLFLGKQMMDPAESHETIPEEIFARRGHQAIEVGICCALTFEIMRQKHTAGSDASLDAGNCYDQLAHNMALIMCQRHGMAIETITCLFLTIQMMKFFLRTAFGDSETFYSSTGPVPFQGICQGNGGGPTLFLCISIVLAKTLHDNGHVAVFVSAIISIKTQLSGLLYVDNASMTNHANYPEEPVSQIIMHTQACMDTWQGALRASGGDLKASKSAWTLIDFIWVDGQWQYHSIGAMPAKLTIKGPNDKEIEVKWLEAWEVVKIVGVHQAANGDMSAQIEVISEKIDNMGTKIRDNWVP